MRLKGDGNIPRFMFLFVFGIKNQENVAWLEFMSKIRGCDMFVCMKADMSEFSLTGGYFGRAAPTVESRDGDRRTSFSL